MGCLRATTVTGAAAWSLCPDWICVDFWKSTPYHALITWPNSYVLLVFICLLSDHLDSSIIKSGTLHLVSDTPTCPASCRFVQGPRRCFNHRVPSPCSRMPLPSFMMITNSVMMTSRGTCSVREPSGALSDGGSNAKPWQLPHRTGGTMVSALPLEMPLPLVQGSHLALQPFQFKAIHRVSVSIRHDETSGRKRLRELAGKTSTLVPGFFFLTTLSVTAVEWKSPQGAEDSPVPLTSNSSF